MGVSVGTLILWDGILLQPLEIVRGIFSVSISFKFSKEGVAGWAFGVYGPTRSRLKKAFWEELESLFGLCGSCWCGVWRRILMS